MDLAQLGLAVDSREVVDASRDLERIRAAAAKAEKAADSFGAHTEAAGRRAAAANDNSARSADRAAKAYGGYSKAATLAARAIGAVVGAAAGAALIHFADTWSDLDARVGLAIGSMDASGVVLERIGQVARRTYSSLELSAESFIQNSTVLKELGRSTKEQLDYTEALNLALVVSGAKAERAASVQDALSRAMALGALRGNELDTVLKSGGRVAEVLAEELGIGVNQLRSFGTAGKITGDVIYNALTKRLTQLQEEAEKMPATIGDGLLLIRNALLQFVGGVDQAVGASETFAAGLIIVADNIGRIVTYGATAVAMYGSYYVAAFVAAQVATMGLTGALALLRAALIRTGIGAVIVLAGELVYQFGRLVDATGGWADAFREASRRTEILLDAVVWAFRAAGDSIQAVWAGAMADILRSTEATFGGILRMLGVSAEAMAGSIASLENRATNLGEAAKSSAIIAAEQFKIAFADLPKPHAPDLPGGGGGLGAAASGLDKAGKAAQRAADAYKKIVENARQFIAEQELEARVVGMSEEAANRLRYEQEMLNKAANDNINLTAAQRAEIAGLAQQMSAAEAATKRLQEAYDFAKETTKGFVSDLRQGLEQGKGFWESFANAARNAINKIIDKLLNDLIDAIFQVNGAATGSSSGGFLGAIFGGIGKLFGFANGGYTGRGAKYQPAGIVHRGEYVFSKRATDRIGIGALDQLHRYGKGYAGGGHVAPARLHSAANTSGPSADTVRIVLRDDSGRMAEIADQRIQTASGTIVQVSVQQSTKAVKSQMPGMLAEAQARKM
ncbi:lambda family phage tail tape measure protein [Pseudaminobacter salicylatoxidans]|uniref:Lambda family phage tail tape measure protein n=1 Tax=Pseudaminobacter salicylatoxidans TaxID=93369 RepID=A0A316BZY4_PSESE|nr:tape measure protein [Pseudaminobacter salicylatoxidans]PWJ80646.1 lambda family phage tail tape measure protein [Pseudaminobacter salicylatoxidans]